MRVRSSWRKFIPGPTVIFHKVMYQHEGYTQWGIESSNWAYDYDYILWMKTEDRSRMNQLYVYLSQLVLFCRFLVLR